MLYSQCSEVKWQQLASLAQKYNQAALQSEVDDWIGLDWISFKVLKVQFDSQHVVSTNIHSIT